jgi:hypothetical protein
MATTPMHGTPIHLAYLNTAVTQRVFNEVLKNALPSIPRNFLPYHKQLGLVDRFYGIFKQPYNERSERRMGLDKVRLTTSSFTEALLELISENAICKARYHAFAPDVIAADGQFAVIRRKIAQTYSVDNLPEKNHDSNLAWRRSMIRGLIKEMMLARFGRKVDYQVTDAVCDDGALVATVVLQEELFSDDFRLIGTLPNHSTLITDHITKIHGQCRYGLSSRMVETDWKIKWHTDTEGMMIATMQDEHGIKSTAEATVKFDSKGMLFNFSVDKLGGGGVYLDVVKQDFLYEAWSLSLSTSDVDRIFGDSPARYSNKGLVFHDYSSHNKYGWNTGLIRLALANLSDMHEDHSTLMRKQLTELKAGPHLKANTFLHTEDDVVFCMMSRDENLIRELYAAAALAT